MATIVATEANENTVVQVGVGDTLTVQLPENPTTGFRWMRADSSLGILALDRDDFLLNAQAAVGGGGLRIFQFVAKSEGHAALEFSLLRSWESAPPNRKFQLGVDVKPK